MKRKYTAIAPISWNVAHETGFDRPLTEAHQFSAIFIQGRQDRTTIFQEDTFLLAKPIVHKFARDGFVRQRPPKNNILQKCNNTEVPALRQYHTFISHAWRHHEDYYRIEQMLDEARNFSWNNLSVPRHDPILNAEQLTTELHNQMRPAEIFIILAGMYVAHSEWIQYEINFARRIGKPILGIRPWASTVVPLVVQNGADDIVGWNAASIVNAIRKLAL